VSAESLESALSQADAVRVSREALSGSAFENDVWIVGGAIRDALLGEEVHDVDLVVPAGEEKRVAGAIADAAGGYLFALSERHGTWRAISADRSWHADVTALRGKTIEADLAERDFAINAVAVALAGGEPIDPAGGVADAAARRLRAVSARSFDEDPLRLLRAPRIAAGNRLEIDAGTAALARTAAPRAAEPAGERQFAELRGAVAGPDPLRAFSLMDDLDLTIAVLPELAELRGVVQTPNHHLDVHGHTIAVLEHVLEVEADLARFAGDASDGMAALLAEPLADGMTRGDALRWGALLHDIGKPATRTEHGPFVSFKGHDRVGAEIIDSICERLRTSRAFSVHVQGLALHHLHLGFLVHERPLSRRVLYDYLSKTEPVSADVTLLTAADRLAARGEGPIASDEMIEAHLELVREVLPEALAWHASPPRPPLDGDELAAEAGIEPGPRMGEVLEQLRAAAFEGEISSRDDAVAMARELAG
jgi:putative nucleotidyltransferase with HDIG domain